jgi:hypothetical protein
VVPGHQPGRRAAREAVGVAQRWALEGIVWRHLTVARVAEGLGVWWTTANDAVLAEGRRVLIQDPHRFDGSGSGRPSWASSAMRSFAAPMAGLKRPGTNFDSRSGPPRGAVNTRSVGLCGRSAK